MAEKEGKEDYWSKLPWELKEEIVGYLSFFYKLKFRQVCRETRDMIDSKSLRIQDVRLSESGIKLACRKEIMVFRFRYQYDTFLPFLTYLFSVMMVNELEVTSSGRWLFEKVIQKLPRGIDSLRYNVAYYDDSEIPIYMNWELEDRMDPPDEEKTSLKWMKKLVINQFQKIFRTPILGESDPTNCMLWEAALDKTKEEYAVAIFDPFSPALNDLESSDFHPYFCNFGREYLMTIRGFNKMIVFHPENSKWMSIQVFPLEAFMPTAGPYIWQRRRFFEEKLKIETFDDVYDGMIEEEPSFEKSLRKMQAKKKEFYKDKIWYR
ncbi:hypothetical protein B9Z55_004777 [Caenorhabditis nigoni]|uniref:F-box domain-containing protein n=1 Tax=Caenorhabditis nigoni TaxID=1611254 RepID=A0A2G5UXZ9_9PELO|nr:hypothetical protein B9Z55_004777 [Caenorhabditis nigoni]